MRKECIYSFGNSYRYRALSGFLILTAGNALELDVEMGFNRLGYEGESNYSKGIS